MPIKKCQICKATLDILKTVKLCDECNLAILDEHQMLRMESRRDRYQKMQTLQKFENKTTISDKDITMAFETN